MAIIVAASISQAHVQAAHDSASPGDTVQVPAGSATWGAAAALLIFNKAILIEGAGDTSIINLSDSASGDGTIRISNGGVFKDFLINSASAGADGRVPFSCTTARDWRITGVEYVQVAGHSSYFAYVEQYGLIDHCSIGGNDGTSELIFMRGPTDSWQTASSIGTADAVFIEDNIFYGEGYVCDGNDNSRVVARRNTIYGPIKIDGHGYASNSLRGVRHMEIYDNVWPDAGYFTAIEVRGGTGMIFRNTATTGTSVFDWFFLTDYAYLFPVPNFGNVLQQPSDYPLKDQIGVGIDPKAAASEPMYIWGNTNSEGSWPRTLKDLPVESEAATEREFIQANRDFYADAGFDTATGVTVGTTAAMNALTPAFVGYGFWVTDQGNWDATADPDESGLLYRWDGADWVLHYTPYTYPHPLASVDAPEPPDPVVISPGLPLANRIRSLLQ